MAFDGLLTWTPRDEATPETLKLSDLGSVTRFRGSVVPSGSTTITQGRKHVRVNYSPFMRFDVAVESIGQNRAVSAEHPFAIISSFQSHALAGGEFRLDVDSTKTVNTTTSSGVAQGATAITYAAGTLAVDDWVYLEDVDDATKWEYRRVTTGGSGTATFYEGVSYGFGSGSILRHMEVYPTAIVAPNSWRLNERDGGEAVNTWDLGFVLETVR